MKDIRILALAGSLALLSGCLSSNTPSQEAVDPGEVRPPADAPVLRDPDNNPVLEVPVEMLLDVRKQMLEKGLTEDVKLLEAAYDFQTGKVRSPAK